MSFIFGGIIFLTSLHLALSFLGQTFDMYIDHVAFAIVVGSTLAITLVVLPWSDWRMLLGSMFKMFLPRRHRRTGMISHCLKFINAVNSKSKFDAGGNNQWNHVLVDGKELIDLGFSTDEIATILQERVYHEGERKARVANAFTALAKYPPAFGLIGTVFGLVDLMRSISEGLDPAQTGVKMAIALVATLYGLVLANLVIAPIAENVSSQATDDRKDFDIALQAVLLASDRVSILKAQELLNSFVPKSERIKEATGMIVDGEAA